MAETLQRAFHAALGAAAPGYWLGKELYEIEPDGGGVCVLALGKAAIPMMRAIPRDIHFAWRGLAITPRGTAQEIEHCTVLEAAHPVPDAASVIAGETALAFASQPGPKDLLLVLVSGGASALACAPIPGVSLAAKAEVSARLLASGASIGELNTVRRALSRLKGGGLARETGAGRVVTLAMSDVPGDALADIGSGPGIPSPTGAEEARAVLERLAPDLFKSLRAPMRAWAAAKAPITIPTDGKVAFPLDGGVRAAATDLGARGWRIEQLGVLSGGVEAAVARHVEALKAGGRRAILSGGELDVPVPPGATGRGGRNQHFLLSLAVELAGRSDVWALAADTDGIDGTSDAAGARLDPGLLKNLDVDEAKAALADFDAHGFFERHGRLVRTGPTGVNVGDLRMLLVDPDAAS